MNKNHLAVIVLIVGAGVDYAFASYARQLSQAFQMSELALLLRMRPILLAFFYGLLCLAASRVPGKLSPYLMALIAAVLLWVAFPLMNHFGVRLSVRIAEFMNAVAPSQLGLIFNAGGLILGFGLYQHLASKK